MGKNSETDPSIFASPSHKKNKKKNNKVHKDK